MGTRVENFKKAPRKEGRGCMKKIPTSEEKRTIGRNNKIKNIDCNSVKFRRTTER
jgi:hypothetical protein